MKSATSTRPTLRDIAQAVGCSTAVASTVINKASGRSGASQELATRIRDTAKAMGYRPHYASRALRKQRAEAIGLFLPPEPPHAAGYSYATRLLLGIEEACKQREYDLLAINIAGTASPKACIRKFDEGRIDGLVILQPSQAPQWLAELASEHPNIVAINYLAQPEVIRTVCMDNFMALDLAVGHLAELGHQRIAYVGTPHRRGMGGDQRCQAFSQAMTARGLSQDASLTLDHHAGDHTRLQQRLGGDYTSLSLEAFGEAAADYFVSLSPDSRPTAIATYSDDVAAALLLRLTDRGISVPSQMSVMGIDDAPLCQFLRPSLSTIRQPLEKMGFRAAELAIDGIHRKSADTTQTVFDPDLVLRQSTSVLG